MLPTIKEAKKELEIASKLNPGPWVKHSLNVGMAARNIAQKVPELDENKAYFEEKMGCSIYDVLPDIGKTTLLCPLPWKLKQNRIGEDSI